MATLEHCLNCGDPTGRAGRHDDSLFEGDIGPFCEDCWAHRYKIGYADGIIEGERIAKAETSIGKENEG